MRVWIAAVALLLAFPVLASATLIVNGGFETGDFTGWTLTGDTSFTGVECFNGNAHSGDCDAYFGPTGGMGYLSQTIATTPGAEYQTTFWLRNDDTLANNNFVFLWDGVQILNMNDFPSIPWAKFTVTGLATGTSSVVTFGFFNPPSYWRLDDVEIIETTGIPEPASLALIGLGLTALALLRRRLA